MGHSLHGTPCPFPSAEDPLLVSGSKAHDEHHADPLQRTGRKTYDADKKVAVKKTDRLSRVPRFRRGRGALDNDEHRY